MVDFKVSAARYRKPSQVQFKKGWKATSTGDCSICGINRPLCEDERCHDCFIPHDWQKHNSNGTKISACGGYRISVYVTKDAEGPGSTEGGKMFTNGTLYQLVDAADDYIAAVGGLSKIQYIAMEVLVDGEWEDLRWMDEDRCVLYRDLNPEIYVGLKNIDPAKA